MRPPPTDFDSEHLRLLFRNTGIGQLIAVISAAALVFIVAGARPAWGFSTWWLAVSAVALLRFAMAVRFKAGLPHAAAAERRWRAWAVLSALLAGSVWAAGVAAMTIAQPESMRLFVALFSLGMIAGAVPLLSSVPAAFRAYALPICTTFALACVLDAHGPNDWALALMTLLFLGAMLQSARRLHASLAQSANLARQKQSLADQLETSERLFRTLAESTSVAIFTYRQHVEYINPAGEKLCGYSRQEMQQLPLASLVHPDDRRFVEARLRERIAGAPEFTQDEIRIVTRDGSTRWLLVHGASIAMDGAVVGLGSACDITERKAAERRLVESEAMFHTMVDWTHDWEYWSSPDGPLYYMTPSAERITGHAPGEFAANPALIATIVHPDDRLRWQQHRRDLLRNRSADTAASLEMRILKKSGEVRWVSQVSRAVRDAAGKFDGLRVTVRDITDAKSAEESIRLLAHYDPLTRLPNRRLLMERLGQALLDGERGNDHGALLMIDIDHFKSLNDTRGHDVGDALLVEVARRLSASTRADGTVSRLGGDEYLVMLDRLGTSERAAAARAESVAESIRIALARPYRLGRGEHEYHSTVSIGLTLFRGAERPPDVLLTEVDVALYQAKDAGRNAIRFFNPDVQAEIEARLAMIDAMRHGLDRDEFTLHYQPQCNDRRRIVGAEALLRWNRAGRGLVPPGVFIPLAEDSGLIQSIGTWVLDTACAQLAAWSRDARTADLQLAVNVSAKQFHDAGFVDLVRRCLEAHGADPSRLKLELTEGIVLDDVDRVIDRMRRLTAIGVEFALDDFGTGYSSLSYLKRLPLREVKIDQSFVRDAPHDANDAAIVKAILAITGTLGLRVVAEGVETDEQLGFLQRHGCREFQGYLFERPLPIDEWEAVLQRQATGTDG